jgi:hypothetical protein
MSLPAGILAKHLSFLRRVLVAAGLLLGTAAAAGQVTWIADTRADLDVRVVGAIPAGAEMSISYESPSGLWSVTYNFSVGSAGFDSKGDELYRLNVGSGEEIYWNGRFFFEPGWGELSPLPVFGGQSVVTNSFLRPPGSLWSAKSRIHVSADPNDPTMLQYTITFLANGPSLPALPEGGAPRTN